MDFYTNNHNPHTIYHTEAGTKITAKIVLGSYFEKKKYQLQGYDFHVSTSCRKVRALHIKKGSHAGYHPNTFLPR